MGVLTSGIRTGAKMWLLILAVAIASLALAPGSRPADATGGTQIYFTYSLSNPRAATNVISVQNGPPVSLHVWVENPKDPDWDSGVGAFEVDLQYDPTLAFVTTAEYDQCGLDQNVDDDGDRWVNDGCPAVGPGGESGTQCGLLNFIDDDGDGFVNDGCPQVGDTAEINQCANAVDDDGDGFVNDGCIAFGTPELDECANALDDDGDGRVNNGCPMVAPPAETGAQCLNNLDDENGRDGWINDGCPQRPEEGPECDNALDDDGDGVVNDGCPTDAAPEIGAECGNAIDDDSDGWINDGCPPDGPETACAEVPGSAVDDDNDGTVNDGCPAVGLGEDELIGTQCGNDLDDDGDGFVNDGCPETSSSEAGGQCLDAVDNDGDLLVNDGCPVRGVAESVLLGQCDNNTDDDGDTIVNDGCPPAGTKEGEPGSGECGNAIDDDSDGWINDGCPQRGSIVVVDQTWLGSTGRSTSCSVPYMREVAGSSPLRWHVNFSCSSFAPPDQGVQVSGLLGTVVFRPGSFIAFDFLAYAPATSISTPGHTKDINPPDGVPDTIKEPTELAASVFSAQWRIARCGDRTGDRFVALGDFLVMLQGFGAIPASSNWDQGNDLNDNGQVSLTDFLILLGWFGRIC